MCYISLVILSNVKKFFYLVKKNFYFFLRSKKNLLKKNNFIYNLQFTMYKEKLSRHAKDNKKRKVEREISTAETNIYDDITFNNNQVNIFYDSNKNIFIK